MIDERLPAGGGNRPVPQSMEFAPIRLFRPKREILPDRAGQSADLHRKYGSVL